MISSLQVGSDFCSHWQAPLPLPGMRLESKLHGRLSVVFPEHWLPTGKRRMHWRARTWTPDTSHWDQPDHSDQLSAVTRRGTGSISTQWVPPASRHCHLTGIALTLHMRFDGACLTNKVHLSLPTSPVSKIHSSMNRRTRVFWPEIMLKIHSPKPTLF